MRYRSAWLVLFAAMVALAGCGIPTDEQARVVPVEVGLEYAVTPIPTTPPGITEQASGIVYFIDEMGNLTPVERTFEATRLRFANNEREAEQNKKEAVAKGLVEQLLAGPTAGESAEGIRTYWPGDVSVLDVEITVAGSIIVEITDESRFEVSPIDERRAASSELVFTLTELPGIESVRLTSPTSDLRLVTDAGAAAALAPVSRAQYATQSNGSVGGASPSTTPDTAPSTAPAEPTTAEPTTAEPTRTAQPTPSPTGS